MHDGEYTPKQWAEIRMDAIAEARQCTPPVPCGRGAGGNGGDLPCLCEEAARDLFTLNSPEVIESITLTNGRRYVLTEDGYLLNEQGTFLGRFDQPDEAQAQGPEETR